MIGSVWCWTVADSDEENHATSGVKSARNERDSRVKWARELQIRSRSRAECGTVGQAVDAEVTIECENCAKSALLCEGYERCVGQVHRNIPILLHQHRRSEE